MSSNNKKIFQKVLTAVFVCVFAASALVVSNAYAEGDCMFLNPCDMEGIAESAVTALTGAVYVAGGVGVIICGIIWATALDNDGRVAMAKRRMTEIIVGVAVFALMDAIITVLGLRSDG